MLSYAVQPGKMVKIANCDALHQKIFVSYEIYNIKTGVVIKRENNHIILPKTSSDIVINTHSPNEAVRIVKIKVQKSQGSYFVEHLSQCDAKGLDNRLILNSYGLKNDMNCTSGYSG